MKRFKVISKIKNVFIEKFETLEEAEDTFNYLIKNGAEWAYLLKTEREYLITENSIEEIITEFRC